MASDPTPKISFVWLFWLLCFSLCFAALYYPEINKANFETAFKNWEAAADLAGGLAAQASQPEAVRLYSLQGPRGLLPGRDVNASALALNNRGQVVLAEQENADLLTAFAALPALSPGQPGELPKIITSQKIVPDAEAVKQIIAAKQQEIFDDTTFKAMVGKLEAETKAKKFSERANQMPDCGLGLLIKKYSRQHGVDARLVWAVIRNESGFNPQAVSPKGAMGLMQLIPSTAALMGVSDPFDAEQNISGGVRFLKLCLKKFNNNVVLALAAYNAGPDTVSKYQGCPPFAETMNYVLKIMRDYTGRNIALASPVLAPAKARPDDKGQNAAGAAKLAATKPESGLNWQVPGAKFKIAGPTWKLPTRATIIVNQIPEAVRQNPEVTRLLAKQNALKLLP